MEILACKDELLTQYTASPLFRFWHITLTFDFDIVIYQDMSINNCFIPSQYGSVYPIRS